jgi:transposase
VAHRVGTLVVGDPKGITHKKSGRRQNWRVNTTWRRVHLTRALTDKALRAGIAVVRVDERGTSRTCPGCGFRNGKPKGREVRCSACGHVAHRDLVGATNIARKYPGAIVDVPEGTSTTHRRAGTTPARRDRRRHLWDARRRRSCSTPSHFTVMAAKTSLGKIGASHTHGVAGSTAEFGASRESLARCPRRSTYPNWS